jgi:AsmA-like C-terminal region
VKIVKKISIILGIILVLLATAGVIFSTLYEDEVKAYILEQINENVDTKIDVKEVNFSVFKKFPYASLEFKKVTAEEVVNSDKKGTLFSAQKIYLQFNIIDILNKDYTIKKVNVENGIVNVKIDKNGNDNYHFWKTKRDSAKSKLNVELEDLRFKGVTFYILNEYKNLDMAIEAVNLSLSGNFSSSNYTLKAKAELLAHQVNDKGQSLLKNKRIFVNTSLDVNQKTQLYTIKSGSVSLEDLTFNLAGNIKNKETGVGLNIQSKGSDIEIESLFSLFPEKQKKALDAYEAKGKITYTSTITGELSIKNSPAFSADFNISNGEIIEKSSNKALTNLVATGSYTNGTENNSRTSKLNLNQLDADFGAGHISGNYIITNFTNPYIEFNSNASIDIETAKEFFKIDTLEVALGNLIVDVQYKGSIKELSNIKAKDLQKLNATGSARVMNANLKLFNNPKEIKNVNGSFRFNNNDIIVDTLNFKIDQSDIELEGKFRNLLAYLFIENQNLGVNATIHSQKLILDDILLKKSGTAKNEGYTLNLPSDIQFIFQSKIDTFKFRKFTANNFTGTIQLEEQVLTATNVSFKAVKGEIKGDIAIDASKQKEILITSKAKLTRIDVQQLFHQMENFGQKEIKSENIKGRATTTVEFASVWDKQLNVDKDKIYVLADVTISNGELINYKPVLAMSKFINVEELERIKFSTLTTQIEIKDQTVFIPKTDINSSAIDITISGTHTFNNEIDYRFKLLMNDILWRKAKGKKKENEEFGYIEDDGLGRTTLFLHMTGTIDDYKLSYDTKGLKESWKEDLKKEKTNLKQILNKEFGWFKKDTSITKEEKPKDDGFILEWEEEENDTTDNKKADSKKKGSKTTQKKDKKKKKGLGKFIDKIAQPDAEEFEEDDEF